MAATKTLLLVVPEPLCPAGLGLHQRPEDGGVWQEDRTAPDKQALMSGGGPQASPRSCVLAAGAGELAGLPEVSSPPLDQIFDCKVFFVNELLIDSQRYKPTKTVLLMNYPQINVLGGNHPFFFYVLDKG